MIAIYFKPSQHINGTLLDFLELYGFLNSFHPNTFLFLHYNNPSIINSIINSRYISFNQNNIKYINSIQNINQIHFNSFICSGANLTKNITELSNIKANKKFCIMSANLFQNQTLINSIKNHFKIFSEIDKKIWLDNLMYNSSPSNNTLIQFYHINNQNLELLKSSYPNINFISNIHNLNQNLPFLKKIKNSLNITLFNNFIPNFFNSFSSYLYIKDSYNQSLDYSPRLIIESKFFNKNIQFLYPINQNSNLAKRFNDININNYNLTKNSNIIKDILYEN